jgi:hypothetical protein
MADNATNPLLTFLQGLFNPQAPAGGQERQGPDYFDRLTANWPPAGRDPWQHDPASEDFWRIVNSNRETAYAPSGPTKPDTDHAPPEARPPQGSARSDAIIAGSPPPRLSFRFRGVDNWTRTHAGWQAQDEFGRAAIMSLMERRRNGTHEEARNIAATMVNRSRAQRLPLGDMVGSTWYQPSIEPGRANQVSAILASPEFRETRDWIERYANGRENDPTGGATHFIVHERTMLGLEAGNPRLYRTWRTWTRFNAHGDGRYDNVTMRDPGHAFLAPQGRHSIRNTGPSFENTDDYVLPAVENPWTTPVTPTGPVRPTARRVRTRGINTPTIPQQHVVDDPYDDYRTGGSF